MIGNQHTSTERGYVLRTDDGKYLSENDHDWGPSVTPTHIQFATVYTNNAAIERIKRKWGGHVDEVLIHIIKTIYIEE